MPRPNGTARDPDFFAPGAVALAAGCTPVTARLLMLELRARGVSGIYVVDNGCHIADQRGLRACVVEFANRRDRNAVPASARQR